LFQGLALFVSEHYAGGNTHRARLLIIEMPVASY